MFPRSLRAGITTVSDGRSLGGPGHRPQDGHGDEGEPAEAGNRRHDGVDQRADAVEVPGQVRHRAQANQLESRQACQLREIGLRQERADRRALPDPESIGEPVQPGEVPVVERDHDPAAPGHLGPNRFEESLDVGGMVEISVEEDDVDPIRHGAGEVPKRADDLRRGVDRLPKGSSVTGLWIDVDDAIGIPGHPRDLPRDQRVCVGSQMAGKCGRQTAKC